MPGAAASGWTGAARGQAGACLVQHGLQVQPLPWLSDALEEGQQVVVQVPPVARIACDRRLLIRWLDRRFDAGSGARVGI
jgi:hypothetical protein